jgi:PAS domain S-box-containing protein
VALDNKDFLQYDHPVYVSRPSASSNETIKVLHIDDDEDLLFFSKTFLEQDNGIQVTNTVDPEKAILLIETGEYDCVLTDYKMPKINGIQLSGQIREISDIPIIIYTGQGSEEVAEQAFRKGIDSYMRKEMHPANYHVLGKNIKNVVERYRARVQLRESERRFRKLVEDSPLSISVTSGDRIVFANKKRLELTGKGNPGDIVGSSGLERVHPEDRRYVLERLTAKLSGESVSPAASFRLVRSNGSIIYVEDHMSDTIWEGEAAVLHSLVDLTDRVVYEKQLKALHRYGAKLQGAEDKDRVAEVSLQAIESLMGFSSASFGVVEGEELVFTHVLGLDTFHERTYSLHGPGITVRAVNTSETQCVGDTRQDQDFVPYYAEELDRSHLSELDVPVKLDGEVVAVINVEQEEVVAFSIYHTCLLELLAIHVSSAFERLREEERRRAYTEKLEALYHYSTCLAASKSREEVYDTALEIMKDDLGYSWVGLGLVEEDCLRYIRSNHEEHQGLSLPLDGPGVTVRAVRMGSTQLVSDTRKEPEYIVLQESLNRNLSELAVPVSVNDRVFLVLNLESEWLDDFGEDDVRFMELLSLHIASALRNILAFEERELYERRLRELNHFGAKVESCSSVEEIASLTMNSIQAIFNYTTGSFGVVEGDCIRFIELRGPTTTPVISLDEKGITVRAVRNRRTQLVPDVGLDPDFLDGRVEGEVTLAELDVPVIVDGDPVALINLESERLGVFGECDADLVGVMAEHVASAIRNIRMKRRCSTMRGALLEQI